METGESFYAFAIASLGVWRITHLVSSEDGPWQAFARLRRIVERFSSPALVGCFYCSSVWVAIPAALWIGAGLEERLLLWPALSAAAILLERTTVGREPPAQYFEHTVQDEGDGNHGLLRKEQ